MNELEKIMNGKQEMRGFRIEGDTIGFDTLKSANWNLTPRDIETIIYTLQEDKNNLQSKIDKAIEFINSKHNWYGDEEEDNEDYLFELEDFEQLLDILKESE